MRRWILSRLDNGRRGRRAALLFCAVTLTVIVLFPLYWMLQTALLPTTSVLSTHPALLPQFNRMNLGAFRSVFDSSQIMVWFENSVIVMAGTAVLSVFVSVFAGFSLSRYSRRGFRGVLFVLLLGRVLPGTLIAIPFFVMFQWSGLLDTRFSVMLANASVIAPVTTFLLKAYFDGLPRELDEAARVDGCSNVGTLWRVLLPLAAPGISATVGFAATASWVDLLFARTLLITQSNWTVPVGIASLIGDIQVNYPQLMAAGALSVVPILVVYWFLEPYLVSGLTIGAIKG